MYHFWTDSHLPIRSVDAEKNLVTFKHKAGKVFTDDFTEDGARYVVENVFEGLDSPGEWYLNRASGKVYYYPRPGRRDDRGGNHRHLVASALVEFEGDAAGGNFVEHLRFEKLAWEHTHFELPPGNSNDRQVASSVTAAVTMGAARGCQFSHCRFSNLGTFAIDITAGCSGNRFVGNEIAKLRPVAFAWTAERSADPPWLRTAQQHDPRQLAASLRHRFSVRRGCLADAYRRQCCRAQRDRAWRLHRHLCRLGMGLRTEHQPP